MISVQVVDKCVVDYVRQHPGVTETEVGILVSKDCVDCISIDMPAIVDRLEREGKLIMIFIESPPATLLFPPDTN